MPCDRPWAGSFHHMRRSGELITTVMEYMWEVGGLPHRCTDNMASGDNLDHRDRQQSNRLGLLVTWAGQGPEQRSECSRQGKQCVQRPWGRMASGVLEEKQGLCG